MRKNKCKVIAFLLALAIIISIATMPAYAISTSCVEDHFSMLRYDFVDTENDKVRTPPSVNSCAYTALSMLLSFYDTYWNDNFVPDNDVLDVDWDAGKYNSETDTLVETFNAFSEYKAWYDYRNDARSNFDDFVRAYDDQYLEAYLISVAKEAELANESDTVFGLDVAEIVDFLEYYLYTERGFTEGEVVVRYERAIALDSNDEELFEIMKSQIKAGYPVIYTGYDYTIDWGEVDLFSSILEQTGGHAMVAYGTVGTEDNVTDIKLHTGWSGIEFTTVNQTEYNYLNSVIWLEINEDLLPHVCSNNYEDVITGDYICACQVYYQKHPKHGEHHRYMYENHNSTTHWLDCACGESGVAENHIYDSTKYDSNKHWLECDCGERVDIEYHTFTQVENVSIKHYQYCFDCGYEEIAPHSAEEVVRLSDNEHLATCSCGETYVESHSKGYCEYNSLANHNIYCNCGEFLGREVHTTITKMGKTYCKGCLHVFDSGSIHPVNGSKDKPEAITE